MVMPARRKSSSRELFIWMNGERVGVWQITPHGDVLQYDDTWLASAQKRPLSLSLPFTPDNRPHKGPLVRAYFDNLAPPQRVKLAMAVRSKNNHWRMQEILPRHWLALGQRQGVVTTNGQGVEAIMADMASKTPQVLTTVQSQLPQGFPARVADPILNGLEAAASKLLNL